MVLRLHLIAVIFFYMILIYLIINSFKHLMNEPTAFEEKLLDNQIILPSFTMCPHRRETPKYSSIRSFGEILEAIENTRNNYSFEYSTEKSYEYV